MSGRVDAARDLRLALHALEAGAIGPQQLLAAVRAWVDSAGRSLSEILAASGLLEGPALASLEERVVRELGTSRAGVDPGRAGDPPAPDSACRPSGSPAPETVAYTGPPLSGIDGAARGPGEGLGVGGSGRRFRVVRPHARGGLGEVFLAFDGELNRTVALKELPAGRGHDPAAQARFLLEAEVTGRLEHPGIVPVYSLGRHEDGRPFYVMRLIDGETLRAAIERFHGPGASARRREDRKIAFRRLLRSVIDACNAIAYAHSRGVVHRDLKPENIMLGPFGETLVVDWGVAKPFTGPTAERGEAGAPEMASADASMTQPGSVVGTPRYMSPEQASGDLERVGPASDIYSLGAILYCVLVGHDAFPDGDVPTVLDRVRRGIFPAPRRIRRSIDSALEAICLKAMATDPRNRHATALELAENLEAWLADVRFRREQEVALGQMKGSQARLCLERAHHCFGRGAHDRGMLWLARALENAPDDPPELRRVIRTSLSGWHMVANLLERAMHHGGEVHALTFCPAGRRLAAAGGDGTARLWDVAGGMPLSSPQRHGGPVRAVAFSPDGRSVLTAGDDGLIRRWDALTGDSAGEPLPHGGPVTAMGLGRDGSRIAAGGPGGLSVWDATAGLPIRGPDGPAVLALEFSPDGETLAVACDDGSVHLVEAATGRPLGDPLAHGSATPVVAFDASGRRLLVGCFDGTARLWNLARRAVVVTLALPGRVRCLRFRPGGDAFATADDEGTARIWDSATGRPIGEPLAHRARVELLAFRPDGTILATGSPDGTVRLWCAATGLPIGPPLAQAGAIRGLVFSPDGRRLATGGAGAVVRCWTVPDPVEGDVERIGCWVRIATELDFDPGDAIRRLDGAASWELRRRLTELGGPPFR